MATTDLNATSGPHLRGKYAVVGVGETGYVRGSGRTTRALGTEAVRKAMEDAGLTAADVDGVLSYSHNDSTPAPAIAGDLGIRPNFYMDVYGGGSSTMDVYGGGSSTEALVGIAMGVIEAGMCNTVAIYRAMNGYSQVRIGGTGGRGSVAPLGGDALFTSPGATGCSHRV